MESQSYTRSKIYNKFIISVAHLIKKESLALFHDKYYIKEFKIEQIDENLARNIYAGIVFRSKKSLANKNELNWLQNELRIFVWTLVYYSLYTHIQIQNFTEAEWQFFSILFPNKRSILFQYQAFNLLKNHNQYKKWPLQQDQLFQRLVKQNGYRLKWSDLGKTLFIESQRQFFRTPKQCRERWLNHLDPSKMKKCWQQQQDFQLIQYVKLFGKKWSNIAKKLLNTRNEHSIKNRFKSLMTKQSKLFTAEVSQRQLIDSLYSRLTDNKTRNKQEKQESLQLQNQKTNKQQEHFIFEERHEQSIFEYCDHTDIFDKYNPCITEILGNVSLNHLQSQTEKKLFSKQESLHENHVFNLKKMANNAVLTNDENCKKLSWEQEEIEKQVRADLFLQEDPFQMLKTYLYNHTSSQ